MNKRRKALSVALATALLIPVLTVTAFGAINGDLYAGYIEGNNRLGENQYLTDPAARDLYNDLIFVSGGVDSASASGYGNFYTFISPATNTYRYEFGKTNPVVMGDGNTYTTDDIKPIGNIKWVLHDGVMIITNDWTDTEVEAKINQSASESQQKVARKTMTQMNFLNYETSYLELTPFRNNPNIETIIIGDNIDYNWARAVFVGCENIKNIICLDGGFFRLVEGSNPEYIIVDGGERSGEFYGTTDGTADVTAYQSSNDRMDFTAYTPGSKGMAMLPVTVLAYNVNSDNGETIFIPAEGWTVVNQNENCKIEAENKISITTQIGDFAQGCQEPNNYWLYDAPEGDFTLTIKVSGGLNAHAQKVGVMVFDNWQAIASVTRRYHNGKGGNIFGMFQRLGSAWGETAEADPQKDVPAYLKLERTGNTFKGWYKYEG